MLQKRTEFDLRKNRDRSHLLCGLAVAVSNIDKIVNLIRNSSDGIEAKNNLMKNKMAFTGNSRIFRINR